jgi:hypothetical protein
MQRFEYRVPRFSCDLPVQLTVNDSTQTARCTEISTTGMKLEIGQPQQVNSFGKVSVCRDEHTLELLVRFAYVQETQAGLDLICTSDADRKTLAALVESVTAVRGERVWAI